jgi:hypothetical protein
LQAQVLGMPLELGICLSAFDADRGASPSRRGRTRACSLSSRATRRRSVAARTPPSTPDPPTSPTSVIPASLSTKGGGQTQLLLPGPRGFPTKVLLSPAAAVSAEARPALVLLAPASLVDAGSPARPRGSRETQTSPRRPSPWTAHRCAPQRWNRLTLRTPWRRFSPLWCRHCSRRPCGRRQLVFQQRGRPWPARPLPAR